MDVNSTARIHYVSALLLNGGMDVSANRRTRLEQLVAEAGGLERLALKANVSAANLSQIRNQLPDSKTGKPRQMGPKLARSIELGMDRAAGWMDTDPALDDLEEAPEVLRVPRLEVRASAGTGVSLPAYDEVITGIQLQRNWVQHSLPSITATSRLAVLSAYGQSMAPTFASGDLLLVDTGVHDVKVEAIYVLRRNEELFVKRLQRMMDGSLMMISDNSHYLPEKIDPADPTFAVLGRVVWAWNGKVL